MMRGRIKEVQNLQTELDSKSVSGGGSTQAPSATLDLTNDVSSITLAGNLVVTAITNAKTGASVRRYIHGDHSLSVLGKNDFVDDGNGEYHVKIVNYGIPTEPTLRIFDLVGGRIITPVTVLLSDDFDTGTIDTSKWVLANPNSPNIIFSEGGGDLILTSAGSVDSAVYADYVRSLISTPGSGKAAFAIDIIANENKVDTNPSILLYGGSNQNWARIQGTTAGTIVNLTVFSNNVTEYNQQIVVSKVAGSRFKITKDEANNIKFWQWEIGVSDTWLQIGATQTFPIGTDIYAEVYGRDRAGTGGSETRCDRARFTVEDYDTELPQ